VKVPADAIIPPEKLRDYLLTPRPLDDKSKFLAQAGFSRDNPHVLLGALRRLVASVEASSDGTNAYGEFLRAAGEIAGPNGLELSVVTVWLRWHADGRVRFVTLKPLKEKRR
jgi:hypothetical protein